MSTKLPDLPNDVLIIIFCFLDVEGVLNIRQVCRNFYDITKWRVLWDQLLDMFAIQQNVPVPGLYGQPLLNLSAQQKEDALQRATSLRRNWLSESPAIVRQQTIITNANSRIIHIQFLSAQSWRWLVCLTMSHGSARLFEIQFWDLQASPPVCAARKGLEQYRGMAINKSLSEEGSVIVLNPKIEVIKLDTTHGSIATRLVDERASGIHHFSSSIVITKDDYGRLYLWDLKMPDIKMELCNPHIEQHVQALDVHILDNKFVVIVKVTSIELYDLPPPGSTTISIILYPISQYKWQWRVDHAAMTVQIQNQRSRPFSTPISIMLRFGSLFPWSINLLHHFELHPNDMFLDSEPPSSRNLPFSFPPILRESIASPVRLHATSDMAFGPYGTAIWTDSHTEDYFNHADRGQRLAGKFSPVRVGDGNEEVELSDQLASAAATSVYAFQEEDSWVRLALDETEGRIALGFDDGRISILEYV